jgi:hypothetical protein
VSTSLAMFTRIEVGLEVGNGEVPGFWIGVGWRSTNA